VPECHLGLFLPVRPRYLMLRSRACLSVQRDGTRRATSLYTREVCNTAVAPSGSTLKVSSTTSTPSSINSASASSSAACVRMTASNGYYRPSSGVRCETESHCGGAGRSAANVRAGLRMFEPAERCCSSCQTFPPLSAARPHGSAGRCPRLPPGGAPSGVSPRVRGRARAHEISAFELSL
jgi:hypothetical protein